MIFYHRHSRALFCLQEKGVTPSILVLDIIHTVSRLRSRVNLQVHFKSAFVLFPFSMKSFFWKYSKWIKRSLLVTWKYFCIMSPVLNNTTLILKDLNVEIHSPLTNITGGPLISTATFNPIRSRGIFRDPPQFFLHNSQSFWANSLKFGDFSLNLIGNQVKLKFFKIGNSDHVIWE